MTLPALIDERNYVRLLGYPMGTVLEGAVRERAEHAERWYAAHGRPRIYCATLPNDAPSPQLSPGASKHSIAGTGFTVTAITAGPEVDAQVETLWAEGRIDEAYFLDRFGVAVVQKIAADRGRYHLPGCGTLPFEEQSRLFEYIARLSPEIEILASGMLKPKTSILALVPFDVESTGGNPCTRCNVAGCSFRRKTA